MLGVDQVRRWLGVGFDQRVAARVAQPVKTKFSATVFRGEADQWVNYLATPAPQRYDGPIRAAISCDRETRELRLEAENDESRLLVARLNEGLKLLRKRLADKPFVERVYDDMLFGNDANQVDELVVRSSSTLPSEGTREVRPRVQSQVCIVLQNDFVSATVRRIRAAGEAVEPIENLGLVWPVLRRILLQLSYPGRPRDRFLEKIDIVSHSVLIAVHALYDGRSHGRLTPNTAGEIYQHYVSEASGIKPKRQFDDHPYFRLLNELATILFKEATYREYEWFVKVLVREYLDDRYLRLSVSGVMPDVTEAMAPMPYRLQGQTISTPLPRLGRYGICDREDLLAWRDVEAPFRNMGFTIIGQLGIGEFGRVYEALNLDNPSIPRRVALKVDRLTIGRKKAIQQAEHAMKAGRDLARSPHVIRLYDAGKLKKRELTYHVLQLVNGDTLDNLVGVTGREHSSIKRGKKLNENDLRKQYEESIRQSVQESWRRTRLRDPFTEQLSLAQAMDLQTSVFLWVERVHEIGYAVNDLKNGNLMISQRGQLKGIDLDAYSTLTSPMDKLTDFLFLSTSLLLYLLHVLGRQDESSLSAEQMLRSKDELRKGISDAWRFDNVSEVSRGRVKSDDVIDMMAELIFRCRSKTYIDDPAAFSQDIDNWIALKRAIFVEEMVLD